MTIKEFVHRKSNARRKKTRQGKSRNTKLKPGQKKYRGQGK